MREPGAAHPRRQGRSHRRKRRELERAIRVDVLAFRRWCARQDVPVSEAAARVRLTPATLALWQRRWRQDHLATQTRGRPARLADRHTRNQVVAMLHLMGPGLGVPTLQKLFPEATRRELEDLARRYRDVYRQRNRDWGCSLRWIRPGAVWAMDFTEPPLPVDDQFGKILVVRDLASGNSLAALPTEEATGTVAADALRALFMAHGAPLVLKSDNGSHFVNDDVEALLARWGTIALLSPPGTPAYNGACEAGIGGLKTRAHHESARHGRAGQWTCDDVETARLLANHTARPWGLASPTPDRAWRGRTRVGLDERQRFAELVAGLRKEVELEQDDGPPLANDKRAWASIERIAVSRALIERGFLQLRRRRITLSIRQRRARKIT